MNRDVREKKYIVKSAVDLSCNDFSLKRKHQRGCERRERDWKKKWKKVQAKFTKG